MDANAQEPPNGQSEMVTIWRTLHLELDRLDPGSLGITQAHLDHFGTWTELGNKELVDTTPGESFINTLDTDGNLDHIDKNDWRGGTLHLEASGSFDCPNVTNPPAQCYQVKGNEADKLKLVSGNLTPFRAGERSFYLRDDLLTSLTEASHDSGVAELKTLLRQVYIEPQIHLGDSVNPSPMVTWTQTLTDAQQSALPRDTTQKSPFYWAVPFVLGFEGQRLGVTNRTDHDPTPHPPDSGLLGNMSRSLRGPNSAIFTETLRDFFETDTSCIRPTVTRGEGKAIVGAHEVLHAMGLAHDGGIMCASLNLYPDQPSATAPHDQLTAKQRATLRQIDQPAGPATWRCDLRHSPRLLPSTTSNL